MEVSFIEKYAPKKLDDFEMNEELMSLIKTFLHIEDLNLLFFGPSGSGKSSIINAIVNTYFSECENYANNVMYISNMHEQGIHYCRNEVRSFCQTSTTVLNKKKIVVMDDLDQIPEQSQHVFRNCIDKYSNKVFFISSCESSQKIIDSFKSRMTIIKLPVISNNNMDIIFNKVVKEEKLQIPKEGKKIIISIANSSIKSMLNFLQQIKLLNYKVDLHDIKKLCSSIGLYEYEKYTRLCISGNLADACKFITNIYNKGYSVIDILNSYFYFIKITDLLSENIKYEVTKIICKYITVFHELHEDKIELVFCTNNLINLFSSSIIQ